MDISELTATLEDVTAERDDAERRAAEVEAVRAELERLRVVHEADTQLLRDVLEQNQLLRARDEAAQAVDQAWREPLGIARARLRQNWPALGSALDAQARTREDG